MIRAKFKGHALEHVKFGNGQSCIFIGNAFCVKFFKNFFNIARTYSAVNLTNFANSGALLICLNGITEVSKKNATVFCYNNNTVAAGEAGEIPAVNR